jgi:long-chain acyl-CoA synthetase
LSVNLGNVLSAACLQYGARIALSSDQETLSYSRLNDTAKEYAGQLIELGVRPNEPVLVIVSNQMMDVAAILGVWLAGGVIIPVHRSSPDEVLKKLQIKTKARFEINTSILVLAKEIPPEREILLNAAFVIFTSGSTGEPKGVVISHQAFYKKIHEINRLLNFKADERTLLVLNINFSFGLWVCLLTLFTGGSLVTLEKFDPIKFLNALLEEKITRVGMVPTMMRSIFSRLDVLDKIKVINQNKALKQILIGGESLGKSLAISIRENFSNTDLIDIYGSTETATCDFFLFPDDFIQYPGCIGRPSGEVRFQIVNQKNELVSFGEIGELQISSPFLMNGYLDEQDLTKKAYFHEWFKTGDLAREVDRSLVELMGRSKEIISRGGNKITPGEIEQIICAHPMIAAAMAVGVTDSILGERIHTLLVLKVGAKPEDLHMNNFFQQKLEKYKHPDAIYILSELPLGRTGKADRGEFKNMILSGAIEPIAVS